MNLHQRLELRALTGVRAIAVWWVVLIHLRESILETFPGTKTFLKPFLDSGYLGVDLFFILSGFIISYQYSTLMQRFSLPEYFFFLRKRLARIYPVHVFTFLIMGCMVGLSGRLDSPFTQPLWVWLPADRFTQDSILSHALLIQGWAVPIDLTWNVVSWSLSCEWLAYLLFPLAVFLTLKITSPSLQLSCSLGLLCLMGILCTVLEYRGSAEYGLIRIGPEFLTGCFLYQFYRNRVGCEWDWSRVTLFAFSASLLGSYLLEAFELKAVWVTPFLALLIYGLAFEQGQLAKILASSPMTYWGRVSYSVYMTHLISLIILQYVIPLEEFKNQPIFIPLLVLAFYLLVIGLIAILTYKWIEEPFRKWMQPVTQNPSLLTKPIPLQTNGPILESSGCSHNHPQ